MQVETFKKVIENEKAEEKRWSDLEMDIREIGLLAWDTDKPIVDDKGRILQKTTKHNTLKINGQDDVPYTAVAMNQLLNRLNIANYTFRKLTAPARENVVKDRQANVENPEIKLRFRRNDNGRDVIAGVVSPSYSSIENSDLLERLVPLSEAGKLELESVGRLHWTNPFDITHYRFVFPDTQINVAKGGSVGDFISAGFHIQNSRVGTSIFKVVNLIYRLVCKNGLIVPEYQCESLKQRHIHVDYRSFFNKFTDAIDDNIRHGRMLIDKFGETRNEWLGTTSMNGFQTAFQRVSRYFPRAVSDKALDIYRSNPAEPNLFGLINSFTQAARDMFDMTDVQRRTEIESIAGHVLAEL